jgi:DnaJ like chaperone protein
MLGFACVGAAIGSMSRSQARRAHRGSAPEPRMPPPPPRPPAAAPAANPWAILGIRPGAPIEEVKRAYRRRMAEYHPDKVASLGVELRELAERKSREINAAYASLSGRA